MEGHEDDPDNINRFHMYLNDVNVHTTVYCRSSIVTWNMSTLMSTGLFWFMQRKLWSFRSFQIQPLISFQWYYCFHITLSLSNSGKKLQSSTYKRKFTVFHSYSNGTVIFTVTCIISRSWSTSLIFTLHSIRTRLKNRRWTEGLDVRANRALYQCGKHHAGKRQDHWRFCVVHHL